MAAFPPIQAWGNRFKPGDDERVAARAVLDRYGKTFRDADLSYVSEPGFSGSRVWRVRTTEGEGEWALRRWNRVMTSERLDCTHRMLHRCRERDCPFLPELFPTEAGTTAVAVHDFWWELARWLPGEPDRSGSPSAERLENAVLSLARWHKAHSSRDYSVAEECAFGEPDAWGAYRSGRWAVSPGLLARAKEWLRLRGLVDVSGETGDDPRHLAARTRRAARRAESWLAELSAGVDWRIPMRVCVGDLHREHVLFVGAAVTGMIDFEAICLDSVARDLARLLGSLAPLERNRWPAALEAFDRVISLTPDEGRLIDLFDRTGLVVATLRWSEWHRRAGGEANSASRGYQRWSELVDRLERVLESGLAT